MRTLKISILTLFFLVVASVGSFANPSMELQKANELYAKKNYSEAIIIYEKIIANSNESASLYFNLGNAYFKNGEIEKAIINYERAKRLSPNDEDINFNLELSYSRIADKIEPLPEFIFIKIWNSIVNLLGERGWAITSMVIWFFTFSSLFWFLMTRTILGKKLSFLFFIIFFFSSIIIGIAGYSSLNRLSDSKQGIIFNTNVDVKSSPDEAGQTLFVIHKGTKINMIDKVDGWVKIKLVNGNTGWLRENVFEKI